MLTHVARAKRNEAKEIVCDTRSDFYKKGREKLNKMNAFSTWSQNDLLEMIYAVFRVCTPWLVVHNNMPLQQ